MGNNCGNCCRCCYVDDKDTSQISLKDTSQISLSMIESRHLFKSVKSVPFEEEKTLPPPLEISLNTQELVTAFRIYRQRKDFSKLIPLSELPVPDTVAFRRRPAPPGCTSLTPQAYLTRQTLQSFRYDYQVAGAVVKSPTQLSDNSVYVGQWKGEKRYGQGTCYLSNGGLMEGYWSNGLHLKGRTIYPNGDVYEGDYCYRRRHGQGRFQDYKGLYSYQGQWQHDRKYGFGIESTSDGATYEGAFVNDMKQGKGTLRLPAGEVYIGDFWGNQKHGTGKLTWTARNSDDLLDGVSAVGKLAEYEGSFVKGQKQGFGVLRWQDFCYEGEFEHNKMHGVGWLQEPGKSKQKWLVLQNKKVMLMKVK